MSPVDDRRDLLSNAAAHALAIRGTLMLEVPGQEHRWCAVCASVQGDLELRVGEPQRTGWRRKESAGEQWLAAHGWTHRIDAWVLAPYPTPGDLQCAVLLEEALAHGLDIGPEVELVPTLEFPGVAAGSEPPPLDAPVAAHLAAALTGPEMSANIEVGRPGRPFASVSAEDGELVVELTDGEEWTELGRYAGAGEAARELSARISPTEPVFVTLS